MKIKSVFFLLLFIPFCSSCEKEFITNTDQIETELNTWEPFIISPVPDMQIGLYCEFKVQIKSIGYATTYTESEENVWGKETYGSSVSVVFDAVIDSVYLTDGNSDAIPSLVKDSARMKYIIIPDQSFDINTSVKLQVAYHFTSQQPEADGLTNQPKIRAYTYSTTSSDTLTSDFVFCEYPLTRQYNFLKDEYGYGYIKTYVKPDFLMQRSLSAVITKPGTDEEFTSLITYDEDLEILKYPMPSLQNNTIYRIDYLMEKDGILQSFFRSNYFKTSRFNTFSDKIGNILEGDHRVVLYILPSSAVSMSAVDYDASGGELLDFYEQVLPAGIYDNPRDFEAYEYPKLVTVQLDTNLVDLNQYMYDIALDLGYRVGRPSAYIGYKPVHDILHFFNIKQEEHEDYSDILLTDDEIQESTPSAYEISNYLLSSYLGTIVNGDLYYFKNQAVNDMERKDDPRVNAITNCKWDEQKFYNTTFYYFLRYELPGINVVTFEGQYEFGPAF